MFNSYSAINPIIDETDEFNSSNLSLIQNKSLLSNRMEFLMGDLTHLMDEIQDKDNTVEKEPHFSNSNLLNNTVNNINLSKSEIQ